MDPRLRELIAEGNGSSEEVEVILKLREGDVIPPGVRIVTHFGEIATCRLRRDQIQETWEQEEVLSVKAPWLVAPEPVENNEAAEASLSARDARRPPALNTSGRGVIVAVVDWGCDFAHPNFRNAEGSTRLLALWDQANRRSRSNAAPYGYGVVYSKDDINRALMSRDPYAALGHHPGEGDPGDEGAHGTHVLDIAAGNGRAPGSPLGIAPQADLVFVHLAARGIGGLANLGDGVRILEALDFIAKIAGKRPWVVNLSMGRCGGPHTGLTLVEQGMDALLLQAPGRAIVQSTGNYFSDRVHATGRLHPGQKRTLTWRTDKADVTPNELEVWYSGHDTFAVTVQPPQMDTVFRVPLGEQRSIQIGDREVGRIYHRARDPSNGDNHLNIFLYPTAPAGPWRVTVIGEDVVDGRFHAWVERDNACRSCQSRFDAKDADPYSTTGTICNGFRTLAVGAYNHYSPELEIARFSSSGPTRDGRQKPDLVAPGVDILAARSASREDGFDSPLLTRKSGTSMAAPHVTGTVACMFEAARRPLWIHETHKLLLGSTRRVSAPRETAIRIGSGILDIEKAVAAAWQSGSAKQYSVSESNDERETTMCDCKKKEEPQVEEATFADDDNAETTTRRNFIIICGGPGLYHPKDTKHDQAWSSYVDSPLLKSVETDPKTKKKKIIRFWESDEDVFWLIYKPAYEARWNDDVKHKRPAVDKVKNELKFASYADLLEHRAAERGWKQLWFGNANELWIKLGGFPKGSISRVWYYGHGQDDLWLSLEHDSDGEAIAPASDAIVAVSAITKNKKLKDKFEAGAARQTPNKTHRFVGCNTADFAAAWSAAFNVWSEGYDGFIHFGGVHRNKDYEPDLMAGCVLKTHRPGGAATDLADVLAEAEDSLADEFEDELFDHEEEAETHQWLSADEGSVRSESDGRTVAREQLDKAGMLQLLRSLLQQLQVQNRRTAKEVYQETDNYDFIAAEQATSLPAALVTTPSVEVFDQPDTEAAKQGLLRKNDSIEKILEKRKIGNTWWYKILYKVNNVEKTGWAQGANFSELASPDTFRFATPGATGASSPFQKLRKAVAQGKMEPKIARLINIMNTLILPLPKLTLSNFVFNSFYHALIPAKGNFKEASLLITAAVRAFKPTSQGNYPWVQAKINPSSSFDPATFRDKIWHFFWNAHERFDGTSKAWLDFLGIAYELKSRPEPITKFFTLEPLDRDATEDIAFNRGGVALAEWVMKNDEKVIKHHYSEIERSFRDVIARDSEMSKLPEAKKDELIILVMKDPTVQTERMKRSYHDFADYAAKHIEVVLDAIKKMPKAAEELTYDDVFPKGEGDFGAEFVELMDEVIAVQEVSLSSSALLDQVLSKVDIAETVSPLGAGGLLSPAEIFDAFASGGSPALQRHFEQFFEVVAVPGELYHHEISSGDVLLRKALGENFAHMAIIAAPERWRYEELPSAGLLPESHRRGWYAQVVESGARPHQRSDSFARLIIDANGRMPDDQMILRIRVPVEDMEWQEDTAASGAALDRSIAVPDFTLSKRKAIACEVLDAKKNAEAVRWNQNAHDRESGVKPDTIRTELTRYVDFSAIQKALTDFNTAHPDKKIALGTTPIDAVFVEAVHQFQCKCFVDLKLRDGRAGETVIDSLGLVNRKGLHSVDKSNAMAQAHFNKLDKQNKVSNATAGEFTAKNWFKNMVNPSFLGWTFSNGIHVVFARKLRLAEKWLLSQGRYAGLTPVELGPKLGIDEEHGGARPTQQSKSMHTFGLATDINYLSNPWIRGTSFTKAFKNAVRLISGIHIPGTTVSEYLHGLGSDYHKSTGQIYDELKARDADFRAYVRLNATTMRAKLQERQQAGTANIFRPNETLDNALKRWQQILKDDLEYLRSKGSVFRTTGGSLRKVENGFLDFHKDLVIALRDHACLGWGAVDFGPGDGGSGDIMHFDCRAEGIGRALAPETAHKPVSGHPCLSATGSTTEWSAEEDNVSSTTASVGNTVTFQSGESLAVVSGPDGVGQEYYDPNTSGNPLLDTSAANRTKRLSKDFSVDELVRYDNDKKSFDKARIDPKLVECLQAIRDRVGKPVGINSGYRSYRYNIELYKKLKKKRIITNSQHISGRAADIRVSGMAGIELAKAAIDACGCKITIGLAKNYIHVDVRGVLQAYNYNDATTAQVDEIKRYQRERCQNSGEQEMLA